MRFVMSSEDGLNSVKNGLCWTARGEELFINAE